MSRLLSAARYAFAALVLLIACWPLVPQLRFEILQPDKSIWSTPQERLPGYPFYQALSYMAQETGSDSLILSVRPADWFYAKRPMVSYLDPRLLPFYAEKDPVQGMRRLRELGITHIYVPPYSIPPLYNSVLDTILADGRYSRLAYSSGYYSLFSLAEQPDDYEVQQTIDLNPSRYEWTGVAEPDIRFVRRLCRVRDIPVRSSEPQETVRSCALAAPHRAIYLSGIGYIQSAEESRKTFVRLSPEHDYRYTARISGYGYARIVVVIKHRRNPLNLELVDEAPLDSKPRTASRVLRFDPDATHVRFGVMLDGRSHVSIHDLKLELLHR